VKGGVSGGGSALYISDKVPAAQQAAAWQYETFLDSATSQATWAEGTGYIPIRESATKTATIKALWASDPAYEVAYNQIVSGPLTPATAGAVDGPYLTVTTAVTDAENAMFEHGATPAAALKTAQQHVDAILGSYDQRIGAG
jgi:ABC-type glycerol-3-phosphate transport system substrate-binding protein